MPGCSPTMIPPRISDAYMQRSSRNRPPAASLRQAILGRRIWAGPPTLRRKKGDLVTTTIETCPPACSARAACSVEIDMVRPVKSFDDLLNAVVMELQRTPAPRRSSRSKSKRWHPSIFGTVELYHPLAMPHTPQNRPLALVIAASRRAKAAIRAFALRARSGTTGRASRIV